MNHPLMQKITGIVLAGGKSSRFGSDKAFSVYRGKTLIDYSIEALRPVCNQLVISGKNKKLSLLGYPMIQDNFLDAGPLAGMEAAMKAFPSDCYLIASCDVPNIQSQLYRSMLERIGKADAIVIQHDGRLHPLIGIYKNSCYPIILKLLEARQFKVRNLVEQLVIEIYELPKALPFSNINRLHQLKDTENDHQAQ